MDTSRIDALAERLDRLERAARPGPRAYRFGRWALAMVGLGVAWLAGAQADRADGQAPAIGARGLNITDLLGYYDVLDYGARGDDEIDDTAAIVAAMAHVPARGGVVVFPPGEFRVSSTLTIDKPLTVRGAGEKATVVMATRPDGDVLAVTSAGVHIRDLAFRSAVPRTAGSFVNFRLTAVQSSLDHFEMYGAFVGVNMASGATLYVEHGSIRDIVAAAGSAGIVVTADAGNTPNDHYIRCITMDNAETAQPTAGIWVQTTGCLNITDCDIIHCSRDLYITGGASIYAINSFFDTAETGICIEAKQPVVRCHFLGCWTCSHTGPGVLIASVGQVDTIAFIGHHALFNGKGPAPADGMYLNGDNIRVMGSDCIENSASGIALGPRAGRCTIVGNRLGSSSAHKGNLFGLFVTEGAHSLIVSDNDVMGNFRGGIASPAVPNSLFRDNLGATP